MADDIEKIKEYNKHISKIWGEIKGLDKRELLQLLAGYDEYVREIINENEGQPVCLAEFYEWDYQEYIKEN